MAQETSNKALIIVRKVLSCIVVAITAFMMIFTIFSTLTFNKNDRNLFGIRFYVVLTDSMSLSENNQDDEIHFDAGDTILIKNVKDPTSLEAGDVIAFISQNTVSFGETVTHMIRERRETTDGRFIGYVTYGTNTGTDDEAIVEPEYVLGQYAGKMPKIGNFFAFLKTTPGYIVCILIPFLILIMWQGVNTIRLFKQYKREQMADMEAEREQIAKEREESAQMMRELLALKAQLAQQNGAAPTAETNTEQPTEANTAEVKTEAPADSATSTEDGSDN